MTEFQSLALSLFGPEPVRAVARYFDVAPRTASRWCAGKWEPEGGAERLREEIARVQASDAHEIVRKACAEIEDAGVHPEAVAEVLRSIARELSKDK